MCFVSCAKIIESFVKVIWRGGLRQKPGTDISRWSCIHDVHPLHLQKLVAVEREHFKTPCVYCNSHTFLQQLLTLNTSEQLIRHQSPLEDLSAKGQALLRFIDLMEIANLAANENTCWPILRANPSSVLYTIPSKLSFELKTAQEGDGAVGNQY